MVTETAPSPAPHWLALFTNSHGCTPTPRLGFLPFNVNWDLGPAAGWVPAACRLGPLFYRLPVGTALLPLCLLAGCLCKATRGHRVEPVDCGPAQGQGSCRGGGGQSARPHLAHGSEAKCKGLGPRGAHPHLGLVRGRIGSLPLHSHSHRGGLCSWRVACRRKLGVRTQKRAEAVKSGPSAISTGETGGAVH